MEDKERGKSGITEYWKNGRLEAKKQKGEGKWLQD
jgi:hypothetical protein